MTLNDLEWPFCVKFSLLRTALYWLVLQDILYTGSLSRLPEYRQCGGDYYSYLSSVTSMSTTNTTDTRLDKLNAVVGDMFDLSLLKSVTFVLVGLSGVIGFAGRVILPTAAVQRTCLLCSVNAKRRIYYN